MPALMLSRAVSRSMYRPLQFASLRRLSSSADGPLPVDVDHYVSGWNVEDIDEFTVPGHFNVGTYNKISPKVRDRLGRAKEGLVAWD